jgi:hypothetical protein
MFNADPNITDVNVREKNLSKILFSMNIHQVATPELSVEDARCYVLFFGEGSNSIAYIALYLTRTDGRIYYSYSSNPFPQEGLAQVEEEARGFVEDMGFVLDEMPLAGVSPAEKNRWIDEQAIFSQKKQPEVQPVQAAEPRPSPETAEMQPRAWKKPDPVAEPAMGQPAPGTAHPLSGKRPESPASQAVRADAAKPAPVQPKKNIRNAAGAVSREREALARLLASF